MKITETRNDYCFICEELLSRNLAEVFMIPSGEYICLPCYSEDKKKTEMVDEKKKD